MTIKIFFIKNKNILIKNLGNFPTCTLNFLSRSIVIASLFQHLIIYKLQLY